MTDISLFVYGTLKRGEHNRGLCNGYACVEEAILPGRLYEYSPGSFPVLIVDEDRVLARGTGNLLADALTQAEHIEKCASSHVDQTDEYEPSQSGLVHGELFIFRDPEKLKRIDNLEGFAPGGGGLYDRDLVAVRTRSGVSPAWVYIVGEDSIKGEEIIDGLWPIRTFGYGSNMNSKNLYPFLQEKRQNPDNISPTELAALNDYELVWNYYSSDRWKAGAANIRESPNSKVYGLLLGVNNGILNAIDIKEGHPSCYKRVPLQVQREDGTPVWAWVYIAEANMGKRQDVWPRRDYLELILETARQYDFPIEYIQQLEQTPSKSGGD